MSPCPLLGLPERAPGRGALAAQVGQELGMQVAQVYRLLARYKASGGDLWALVGGARRDRGQARVVVSAAFETLVRRVDGEQALAGLAQRLVALIRSSWASGATGAPQAWALAVARLADELGAKGWVQADVRAMATLACPRRVVEAEREWALVHVVRHDQKRAYADFVPAVARSVAGMRPGDLVFGDVSPLDIPVLRPDGSTAYGRMIAWMDAASAWVHVTLHLCDAGKGVRREHVAASFASLCANSPIGCPKRLYLDNGSEYKWEDMLLAWRDVATLSMTAMVTELSTGREGERARLIRSIPFRPRGKSIESRFGNLRYWFGWRAAYQGGDRMAKRVANLGKKPTAVGYDEMGPFVAGVLADYHATATKRGGYLDGKSPQQVIDAALGEGWAPVRVDAAALHLAFSERHEPLVRGGKVQVAGRTWFADFLVGRSERVLVRMYAGTNPFSPEYQGDDGLKVLDSLYDEFGQWTGDRLWLYNQTGTANPQTVLGMAKYCAETLGVTHVFIDSLMKCVAAEDDYNGQKSFVDMLCATAKDCDVHIHVVHHLKKPSKEGEMPDKHDTKGSGSITDQVDNLFMVWRNKPKEDARRQKGGASTKASEPDCYLLCRKQRNYDGSADGEPAIALWRHPDAGQFVAADGDAPQFFANYPHEQTSF